MNMTMSQSISARPIEILLVDDDDDDVLLTKKTLEKDRVLNHIHRVEDGVEAMDYLRNQGQYTDATRPDLILLDLNMPRKDSREVLKEVKEDKSLCTIPVVVLTTSEDESDVLASYNYQANSFVTKPVDLNQFRNVIRSVGEYWFSVVKLPPK
jgi:chemotaxis family two-component system response regulator Rcp1